MSKFVLIFVIFAIFLPFTVSAATLNLDDINQKVCDRFELDTVKLAAIMEELRRRKGITETRVAFGGINSQIENADYWVTYAAEAVAFERAQKFSSPSQLRSSLEVLKNKILKSKGEVRKALNE